MHGSRAGGAAMLGARRARGLPIVDLYTDGTFSRPTAAKKRTGAAAELWDNVVSGERRLEDWDGTESIRIEGACPLVVANPLQMNAAGWNGGTAALSVDQTAGLHGATTADRVNASAGQFGPYLTPAGTGRRVLSIIVKSTNPVATVSHQMQVSDGAGNDVSVGSVGAAYVRRHVTRNVATSPPNAIPVEARDLSGTGGQVATAQDVYVAHTQYEEGAAPTSPIEVSRDPENLSIALGDYPASLATDGYQIWFCPDFLPSDMHLNGGGKWLVGGIDNSHIAHGLLCSYNHVLDPARLWVDRVLKMSSPFSWTARGTQWMWAKIRPAAGTIEIGGATTGNVVTNVGPWTMTADTAMWIGRRADGSSWWQGRIGRRIVPL
jgi:hypothetical protein